MQRMPSRLQPRAKSASLLAALLATALPGASALATSGTPNGTPENSATPTTAQEALDSLHTIVVTAPEPRYVAPTRRDRIGRIWAPVLINGRGPFRLVLDSGASTSGITSPVAQALGLGVNAASEKVLLRGVVGTATVPIVKVHSFSVGDMDFGVQRLPIVADALGGADGILGTEGMADHRITIDFHHDLITIARSHGQPAPDGFVTIPFSLVRHELIVVDAWVGNVRAAAIIDTGGQATIANLALRQALARHPNGAERPESIIDVTEAVQSGDSAAAPPILFGTTKAGNVIRISNDRMTFGDMHIFEHWHMVSEPSMLIGMDTLGRLDILIIDYKRHELQIRLNAPGEDEG